MTFVSDLKPRELWRHFDKILSIPRGSKNEAAMIEYVTEIATNHSLSFKTDEAGNIVVSKPGTAGSGQAPITILQSHLDMVCEKNADVEHNFVKDAIKPRQVGDYLYATGTTLGSDNGLGVAAQLAVMASDSFSHGPIELLFTVDEETGLTGAASLRGDFFDGRQLINLDTEEEGALYVGCAGGQGINLTLPLFFQARSAGKESLAIKLHGLSGGHSGVDIHLQRGNAVKLLARALTAVLGKIDFDLISISGGNMHNAIPREGFAAVAVDATKRDAFDVALNHQVSEIQVEFKSVEPEMQLEVSPAETGAEVLDRASTETVLNLLSALPHGVVSMSYEIPELVETSANMAVVKTVGKELRIHMSNRSSTESAIRAVGQRIKSIARLAGAEVTETEGYPGWKPNLDSTVLKIAREVHKDLFGTEAEVKAIHAGLECGIIGEKYPGMDMVSLGPQIEFPHSPGERVRIGSVADFYRLLVGVLERLAQPGS